MAIEGGRDGGRGSSTIEGVATRLAALLTGEATALADARPGSLLDFDGDLQVRALAREEGPADVWAIDGGQALVADARCLQVIVTRSARVRFAAGTCVHEEEGDLRAVLLGGSDERVAAIAALGLDGISPDAAVDVNLVRDRWEWDAVLRSVAECDPGGMVLVDGDLQPDWRIPSTFLRDVLALAAERDVVVAGVTKHSSLSRGGAPLLGWLEREAETLLGERTMWWAPVARTRGDVGGVQVVAARLDPDARFSFRVDLPEWVDPASALGRLSALCDDAAFPGYPYPLSVVDGLAACPGWVRADVRTQLDDLLDRAGVPLDVRDRAFTDRHSMMERA
ncbi:MAG TPA: DNA double-strand break repair nuclease NurA [Acidimicrobiales bacterium]|nr:DNA double-strand break repair nuclease NurA [Acidimicrobiales bacterium]